MQTTATKISPFDHPIPSDEILRKFCSIDPEYTHHESFKNLMLSWNYRGDLTETGDRRLRESMGDEAYEHFHYDLLACNGHILIQIPQYKHPDLTKEASFNRPRFPSPWFWCMADIFDGKDNVMPAYPKMIQCVSPKNQEELSILPGLEFVRITEMRFFSNGKRKKEPAPMEVIFFRFNRGVGCVVVTKP